MDWRESVGIAAGVLGSVSTVYYLVTVIRGQSSPNRVTWFVLTILAFALLASYRASGAKETIWIAVGSAFACLAISLASIKYGEGYGQGERRDRIQPIVDAACLVGAVGCIALLVVTESPGIALGAGILADLVGISPTFVKTYRRPWTESAPAWTLGVAANGLNLFAVRDWGEIAIWIYPVYLTLTCLAVAALAWRKTSHRTEAAT